MLEKLITNRNQRQNIVAAWALRCFGSKSKLIEQRGLRLVEEAIETAQVCGCDPVKLKKLVDHVYSKPPGTMEREIGGVGVCVLALADAAGLDADVAEDAEVQWVLSKPIEYFRERDDVKNSLGFQAPQPRHCGCPCHNSGAKHAYACCGPGSLRPDLTPPEEAHADGDRAD